MNHDAIMGAAGGGKDHLTGHHTRVAAERAARQAAEAVHQSGRRGRTNVAVPTWTGRSGAAGAPPGATGRFGRAPLGARAGDSRGAAEALLDDICGFLEDRSGRAAPTGLIVDAFSHRVKDKGMFRRLLKQAARLEKGAGTAQWVLRDEFS